MNVLGRRLGRATNVVSRLAAFTVFIACASHAAERTGETGAFMGPDGRLLAPIELKDAQEGFAGLSGTQWTIEPGGTYRVSRFVNERVAVPHRTGRLTATQLTRLAALMQAQDFLGLPSQLGTEQKINPHRISVSFGSRVSTLVLPPGRDPAQAATAGELDAPATRLVTIGQTIRALVAGETRP
jgi:hypothetical protein